MNKYDIFWYDSGQFYALPTHIALLYQLILDTFETYD